MGAENVDSRVLFEMARLQNGISELQQAQAALRRAIQARDEILGIVAHDLRNPLNVIQLQAELLPDTSECDHKAIRIIKTQAGRMDRLIADLLDFTSLEAGALSIELEDVDVGDLLMQVIGIQRPKASAMSIILNLTVDEYLPKVRADYERLIQVFDNLVGNAIKFTPAGGTISIQAITNNKKETVFSVSDTGSGISADLLPHVFDRFWKAQKTDRRGVGLGLAIAKGIVEAQGGRIWAESTPNIRTAFYFTAVSARSGR